jgi:alpha-ketoglutarate-dependent taurine dioxygenase
VDHLNPVFALHAIDDKDRFRPVQGVFGAEVAGLDLSRNLPDTEFRRIEQAWFDASFLVFRDLVMTPRQHIDFTRRFGPLHVMTPLHYNHPDHPEVMVLTNLEKGGKPMGIRRAGMGWHSDGEDKRIPNAGSMLYAHAIPPEGGDTLFADMYAAYEALPEATKRRIAGRRARFSRIDMHHVHYPHEPALTEQQKRERPDVFHPLVRTHPRTGRKSLYIGRWARDVEGMEPTEGRALTEELFSYAVSDRFVYRHRWRVRDAVLWDNRCMLHCATPFDEGRYTRLMHRTTLEGDVPF